MNKISHFLFTAIMLVVMTACNTDRFDARLFSVDVPTGYTPEDIDTSISEIVSVQLTALDDKSTLVVMAFPFAGNPEIVLYNQTLGGANPALSNMTYAAGGVSTFDFGDRKGSEIAMSGIIDDISVNGKAYCFLSDGCTFFVYSLAKDSVDGDIDRKVIESIKVNEKAMEEFDSEKRVDTVAALARLNIPVPVDEVTTWSEIKVNHAAKELILIMTLDGTADDYGDINGTFASMHDGMAANLKANRETDWLILVPSDENYTLGYDYITSDGTLLGTLRFTPDELK
ncbi:MAG: hypothetical protein K2L14_06675 [Duncaniella sp.]|nr:hypothetical protein [Duncaniella sp.]